MATDDTLSLAHQLNHINNLVKETSSVSTHADNTSTLDQINDQQQTLSRAFGLTGSAEDISQALLTFAVQYIRRSADYLSAFNELAKQSNITHYTNTFLKTACNYFSEPHPIVNSTQGLEALLCQAYLCHRTLEELNDRIFAERQWPLAPCDTAHANLIAHTIIGDERANLLDQTVLINLELTTAKQTEIQQTLFQQEATKQQSHMLREQGWSSVLEQWPFLDEDMTETLLS